MADQVRIPAASGAAHRSPLAETPRSPAPRPDQPCLWPRSRRPVSRSCPYWLFYNDRMSEDGSVRLPPMPPLGCGQSAPGWHRSTAVGCVLRRRRDSLFLRPSPWRAERDAACRGSGGRRPPGGVRGGSPAVLGYSAAQPHLQRSPFVREWKALFVTGE